MQYLVLGVLVLAPITLLFILKANSSLAFLAICAGITLQQIVIPALQSDAKLPVTNLQQISNTNLLNIIAISLPFLLTIVLTMHSIKGSKIFMHLVPMIACGLALGYLITQEIGGAGSLQKIHSLAIYSEAYKYWPQIVGVGVASSLIGIWMSLPKGHKGKHK